MTAGCDGRRVTGFAAACLGAAVLLLPSPAAGQTYRAVLAGVSEYQYISSLSYCDDDVYDLRDALLQDPRWSSANMTVLTDGRPQLATKENIRLAIEAMKDAASPGDVCLFYFSGHGDYAADDNPPEEADGMDEYICPRDMNPADQSTGISDDELQIWIEAVTAKSVKVIVILDTCFSGGNVKDASLGRTVKGIGPPRKAGVVYDGIADDLTKTRRTKDLDTAGAVVVLTACDDDELSSEDPRIANGIFTHHLIEGMFSSLTDTTGPGNGDGEISAEELYAYVEPQAAAYYNFYDYWRQHAQMHDGIGGNADFFAATPPPNSTIASVTMSANPYWTATGQWAWGQNTGGASMHGTPDPASGHTGTRVYGYNLNGDYENSMSTSYLTSSAFNCSNHRNVRLRFWRRLGVEKAYYDEATIEVSGDNGSTWDLVWSNLDASDVSDTQWLHMEYDISDYADGRSGVRVRWSMGPTDFMDTFCGWNIDDVRLVGDLLGGIAVDPPAFTQEVPPGLDAPAQQFDVWNPVGPTPVNYTVSVVYGTSPSWGASTITPSPTSGDSTGPTDIDLITLTYDTDALPAGTYTATVIVQSIYNQVQIPVVLTVTPPLIARDTAALTQECRWTETAGAQSFDVWNAGAGTLNFQATVAYTDGSGWITGFPVTGSSTGQGDPVTVAVACNTTAPTLAEGTYVATITIADDGSNPSTPTAPGNVSEDVTVTLTVTRPTIGIELQETNPLTVADNSAIPPTLQVPCPAGTDAPLETFSISNTGTGVLEFTVTDDVGWLECSPPAGSAAEILPDKPYTPEPVDLVFDTDGLTGPTDSDPPPTTPSTYTATVTVADPIATNNPQTFTVNLVVDGDYDGDGILNFQEADFGTDPAVADTDNDGLNDGDEVIVHGTDPADWDTDGDSFSDGEEIAARTDPKAAGDHPLLIFSARGGGGCAGGGGGRAPGVALLATVFGLVLALRGRARLAVMRNRRGGKS
ncbi:MAG: caspase family protein [Planctomycetota bacterium]|jgi:hypothetical protein